MRLDKRYRPPLRGDSIFDAPGPEQWVAHLMGELRMHVDGIMLGGYVLEPPPPYAGVAWATFDHKQEGKLSTSSPLRPAGHRVPVIPFP